MGKYGEIFDSTKGYPGEGSEKRRGKKQANSTPRGRQLWNDTLTMWNDKIITNMKKVGKLMTIAHDLWYNNNNKAPKIKWENAHGNITSLNMAGWGDMIDRVNLWKQMTTSKTTKER